MLELMQKWMMEFNVPHKGRLVIEEEELTDT
jgi:hypothetical protein